MRHPLPILSLLALAVAGSVAPAGATTPDPRNSSTDIAVIGNSSGTPMGTTPPGFDVRLRDAHNAPLVGTAVTLDFSATGMRLYAAQNSGTTLDCAARTLTRVTDATGGVNFAARIAGFDNTNAIEVSHQGVVIAIVPARSTDLDGADGQTSLGDFVLFATNFNTPARETDYDLNGSTGLGDFVLFVSEYGRVPAEAYCP